MQKINWNDSWLLNNREKITLPHDYLIHTDRVENSEAAAHEGFFCGDQCVYHKKFKNIWQTGRKKVIVEFEGVMGICNVRLNGIHVYTNYNFYLGFYVDLTDQLLSGDNIIEVTVDNTKKPSSRWYEGLGIYRSVFLYISDPVYFLPDKSFYKLIKAGPGNQAEIELYNEIMSCEEGVLKYTFVLQDASGEEVVRYCHSYEVKYGINIIKNKMILDHCILWDDSNPYLYQCTAEIDTGCCHDFEMLPVGFRMIEISPERGFVVNGKEKKLLGACIHHDHGILGSASYPEAEERKVKLLKEAGFNAVRLAHSPHAKSLIRACDIYGMYVIDELYDMWNIPKHTYDYHRFFPGEWRRDIYRWITRDRNNPCVIMWSIGNEVAERDGTGDGYLIAQELSDECRKYDTSRYITSAVHNTEKNFSEVTEPYFSKLDVCGYNYLYDRYEKDHMTYPERVMYGSESFPKYCYESFQSMKKHSYVIGDFVWTGIDYLGEAGLGRVEIKGKDELLTRPFSLGKYPWKTAYCGDFSITGRKRPQSYYRDIVLGIANGPYIFTLPPGKDENDYERHGWGYLPLRRCNTYENSEDFKYSIFIYCGEGEVELFQNGISLGKKYSNAENHYIVRYNCSYQEGVLKAIYTKDDKIQYTDILESVRTGRRLKIKADIIESLAFLTVICEDDFGTEITDSSDQIKIVSVESGEILAAGNDNPQNTETYDKPEFCLYEGRGLIILKKLSEVSKIEILYKLEKYEVSL